MAIHTSCFVFCHILAVTSGLVVTTDQTFEARVGERVTATTGSLCNAIHDDWFNTKHDQISALANVSHNTLHVNQFSHSHHVSCTWTRMHIILRHFHNVFLNTLHARPQSDNHSVSCTWTRE